MKINLSKAIGISALSLSLSMLPMIRPASAQVPDAGTDPAVTTDVEEDDDFDWGWLGLLGLIGLAGLAGRKRHDEPTVYRDPNVTATRTGGTTYRE